MDSPIKAMREAVGISQRDLARRAGISSGKLSIIERGVTPSPDENAKLLAVLLPLLQKQTEGAA